MLKAPQPAPTPTPQIVYSKDAAAPYGDASGLSQRPDANAPTVVWRRPQAVEAETAADAVEPSAEPLLSPEANEAVALSFGALSANLEVRSAELADSMVRDMLRPMVKQWLDENLPADRRAAGAGGNSEDRARAEIAARPVSRVDFDRGDAFIALAGACACGVRSRRRSERRHLKGVSDGIADQKSMMDKSFDFAAAEGRASALWEETGAFRAGRPDRAAAQPFCVVIPPPNVTGNLHMGHALNNTLQDILCRYWRMNGRDVLWQPGVDHAGIATQMVVERQLMERQEPDRRALGARRSSNASGRGRRNRAAAIVSQLKRLGASCDWSRERFTLDEGLSRAVAKVFVQLYREGLVYKDKRLVNWDPKFQTAISDLEVVPVETKGSFKWSREDGAPLDAAALAKVLAKNPNGHLYYLEYPVVDSEGEETGERVTVATTRPETMLGDTAVAVHPADQVNSLISGIPVVGLLFGGAKHEGVFGATRISGAASAPAFNVSMVSAVTPKSFASWSARSTARRLRAVLRLRPIRSRAQICGFWTGAHSAGASAWSACRASKLFRQLFQISARFRRDFQRFLWLFCGISRSCNRSNPV